MLDKLSSALKKGFDKIAGAIFLDKHTIEEVVKELQRALIQADVNVHLVKELGDKIKAEAANEKIKGIERKEHITKILHDEIITLLGGEKSELKLEKGKSTVIMLVGLYGAGKTTTASKLASYYTKRGFKTAMLGLDVHRAAASTQLEQLGRQNKITVFIDKEEKNPQKIYKKFSAQFKEYDLLIVDTAGRHNLDSELVEEIKQLTSIINPAHKLLVIQADIGQAAKTQATQFKEACDINGVIITRMDSTAKAGGALSSCAETHAPVYFIGTGEKTSDFETFNPKAFISRMLGLGDLEGLIEKVQSAIDETAQKRMAKNLEEGTFNLRDLQEQLKSMSHFSFSKMLDMIPGLGKNREKIPENMLGVQEEKMKKWQHAISSMTEEEINNPEIIEKQTTRLGRIAKGSGTTTTDIRQLIKQYKLLKELASGSELQDIDPAQGMSQKQMMKLAKKFGKKRKF